MSSSKYLLENNFRQFPIRFTPRGETHSTGSAYIAPLRPFFAIEI